MLEGEPTDTLRRSSRKAATTPDTNSDKQNYSKKTAAKKLKTYCICKRPDDHNFMIQCDTCKEWFHGDCVGISKQVGEQLEEYMCPLCEEPSSQRNGKSLARTEDKSRRRSHRETSSLQNSTDEEPISDSEGSPPATPVSLPSDMDDRSSRESSPGYTALPNPKEKSCLYPGCEKPARAADNYCSDSCTIADADNILARLAAREAEHARTFDGSFKRPTGPPPQPKIASPSSTTYASLGTTPYDIPASPPSLCSPHPEKDEEVKDSGSNDTFLPVELQKSYSSEDEEDKVRVTSDPIRVTVRKGLSKTFTEILQGLQEQGELESDAMRITPIDVLATKWANSCERTMLKHWADRPSSASTGSGSVGITGTRYRARFRTIQFNLKDAKNDRLRSRLATGRVLPRDLAVLSSEEMASDELLEEAEESRKRSLQQTLIVEDAAPDTINGRLVKKTHKGWIEVERDDGGMFSSTSPTIANSPSEPFPRSDSASLKRKDDDIERSTSMQRSESIDTTSTSDSKRLRIDTSSTSSKTSSSTPVTSAAFPMSAGSTVQYFSGPRQESPLPSSPGEEDLPDILCGLEAPSLESSSSLSDDMAPLQTAWTTPPSLPPADSVPAKIDTEISVWKGDLASEELGKWSGYAVHALGRNSPLDATSLAGPSFPWAKILSATAISVAGRIPPDSVSTYLSQQRWSTSKEVVAVIFRPDPDAVQLYLDFWDYFHSRTRYGVVKTLKNGYVKDFYIVPYKYGTPLPEFLRDLPGQVPPLSLKNVSFGDGDKILLGAILLNKSPTNPGMSSASMVTEEKQRPPAKRDQPSVLPSPTPSSAFSASSLLSQIPGLASIPPSNPIVPQSSSGMPHLNPIVSQLLMNLAGNLPITTTTTTSSSTSSNPPVVSAPASTIPQHSPTLYGQQSTTQLLNGNTSGLSPAAMAVVAMAAAKARGAPQQNMTGQYPGNNDRTLNSPPTNLGMTGTPPNVQFPWTMMTGEGGYGRGTPEVPSYGQGFSPVEKRLLPTDAWNRPSDLPVRPTEDHAARFRNDRSWNHPHSVGGEGDRNLHYRHPDQNWDRDHAQAQRFHHEGPTHHRGGRGGYGENLRGRGRGGTRGGRGGEPERHHQW